MLISLSPFSLTPGATNAQTLSPPFSFSDKSLFSFPFPQCGVSLYPAGVANRPEFPPKKDSTVVYSTRARKRKTSCKSGGEEKEEEERSLVYYQPYYYNSWRRKKREKEK